MRLAVPVLLVFLLVEASTFALNSPSVYIWNQGRIVARVPLVSGLPSADVYVVVNSSANNYVVLNGSNPDQVLETDSDPAVAVTHALSNWVPTNGKLVTNGTFDGWHGFETPKGNYTWEGWKTVLSCNGANANHDAAIFLGKSEHIAINNITLRGNDVQLYGVANYGWGGGYNNITNCNFYNFTYGVVLGNVVSYRIEYCNFTFCHDPNYVIGGCIQIGSGGYNVISHNFMDLRGIVGTGGIVDGGGHNTITYNTILDWTSGGSPNTHGIYSSASPYDEIAHNNLTSTVTGSSTSGSCALHMKSDHLYIHDNYVKVASGMQGMATYNESDGPYGQRCINNTFITTSDSQTSGYGPPAICVGGGGAYGDYCEDMWFENNTIEGKWETAIWIWHPTLTAYPLNNITFTKNIVSDAHSVAQIGNSAYGDDQCQNVYFYNNTFSNIDGNCEWFYQIPVEIYPGDTNITFHDNVFSNCVAIASTSIIDCSFSNTNLMAAAVIYNNTGLQTGSYPFYMLNMSVVGSGKTVPSGSGWQYEKNAAITITCTPNNGQTFLALNIDGKNVTSSSPYSLSMGTSSHVGIAYFTP
jgi:hypothetical protein